MMIVVGFFTSYKTSLWTYTTYAEMHDLKESELTIVVHRQLQGEWR